MSEVTKHSRSGDQSTLSIQIPCSYVPWVVMLHCPLTHVAKALCEGMSYRSPLCLFQIWPQPLTRAVLRRSITQATSPLAGKTSQLEGYRETRPTSQGQTTDTPAPGGLHHDHEAALGRVLVATITVLLGLLLGQEGPTAPAPHTQLWLYTHLF